METSIGMIDIKALKHFPMVQNLLISSVLHFTFGHHIEQLSASMRSDIHGALISRRISHGECQASKWYPKNKNKEVNNH